MLTFADIVLLFLLALAICIAWPVLHLVVELAFIEWLLKPRKRK